MQGEHTGKAAPDRCRRKSNTMSGRTSRHQTTAGQRVIQRVIGPPVHRQRGTSSHINRTLHATAGSTVPQLQRAGRHGGATTESISTSE
ncbi:hypothetical protein D3C73_1249830 [compost metagenome]